MKFITSFLLLLVPALAAAADDRALQAADWNVAVTDVQPYAITFNTGTGSGSSTLKVIANNLCRLEEGGASRTLVGEMAPTEGVAGLDVDSTGMGAPGNGNSFTWTFVEGIAQNALLYKDNLNNTAAVNMCIEIGLYDNGALINYAEVKMTYNIDLVTQVPTLTGYTVTQADEYNDATDQDLEFDGIMEAFFCDPTTKDILPTEGGTPTTQGSILNICFKTDGGQFEVQSIKDLTISNVANGGSPTQTIYTDGVTAAGTPYANVECVDNGTTDKNVCMISFMLVASFYETAAMTLAGVGNIILEFGGANTAVRRQLRIRSLQEQTVTEMAQVTPHSFQNENPTGSSACTAMTSLAAFGALAGAALAI